MIKASEVGTVVAEHANRGRTKTPSVPDRAHNVQVEQVPPTEVALVSQLVVVRQGSMALRVVRTAIVARLQHKAATLTATAVMTVLLAKQASMVYATNVVPSTKYPMRPRRFA